MLKFSIKLETVKFMGWRNSYGMFLRLFYFWIFGRTFYSIFFYVVFLFTMKRFRNNFGLFIIINLVLFPGQDVNSAFQIIVYYTVIQSQFQYIFFNLKLNSFNQVRIVLQIHSRTSVVESIELKIWQPLAESQFAIHLDSWANYYFHKILVEIWINFGGSIQFNVINYLYSFLLPNIVSYNNRPHRHMANSKISSNRLVSTLAISLLLA